MTLNELKVQVEGRQDIEYLRAEAARYLSTHDADLAGEDCDAFLNSVFKIVCENVQVNGVDYTDVPVDEDTGDVDEGLLKELEQLQQQTEGVLEQVVRYRRAFPGKAADKLSSELSVLLGTATDNAENDVQMEDASDPLEASEQVLSRLSSNVEKTIQLREQVPKTVAKLERARTVLAEQGQKRVSAPSVPNVPQSAATTSQWALAVGGAVGEGDLNDVLTRHRRTSHQFDLAHKLSTAASQFY